MIWVSRNRGVDRVDSEFSWWFGNDTYQVGQVC